MYDSSLERSFWHGFEVVAGFEKRVQLLRQPCQFGDGLFDFAVHELDEMQGALQFFGRAVTVVIRLKNRLEFFKG